MSVLKFTLIADGSSDRTLLLIIKWVLDNSFPELPNKGEFADFRLLRNPPQSKDVNGKIKTALEYFPCDILIYHRDAEKRGQDIVQIRKEQIFGHTSSGNLNLVCIVPVVMMETWLLLDSSAIKKAAGNRHYGDVIELPPVRKLEEVNDPKRKLHELLKTVSGLKGRNLRKFNVQSAVHLVAENTSDFSALRELHAFRVFEQDLIKAVNMLYVRRT